MAKGFSVFVDIGARLTPSFNNVIKTVEGRLSGLTRHFKAQAAEQKAAIRGMMESFKGAAALAAGAGLAFSVKHFVGDGEELAHELQGLRNAGRTAHEVAEGLAEANKVIAKLPTASLQNNIKILNETTGAFGDYHHAVENLGFNAKLADVLKNTVGVEDPTHAIGSLIKALEIRGSASNPEQYRHEAEKLTQAMVFFGGRLKPEDIYTFASNAQSGIRQLNERFLTRIAPSLIQEIGGDKAGTGLTAFRTIISGRKISDMAQAKAWQDLGLLNKKDIITNKKTGEIKGWHDGAIKDTALAYQDPLEFMEKDILPALQKKGTDITDPIKLGAALTTLFKNTKANAFVTAIATVVDRARLKKDEALINKVLSVDQNYDESLLNDPKLARFAIVQAMRNIGAALTMPLMKPLAQTLVAIARAVNQLAAALMAHPGAAKIVAEIGAALAGWAALRLASFALGLTGAARALAALLIAAPIGAAARLVAVANGIRAISAAATLGLGRRLLLAAYGLRALFLVGGTRAALAAIGGSLLRFGKALLLFPLTALRGIGAALLGLAELDPMVLAITAVVAALAALGVWVYNNWSGLKTFFAEFGASFAKNLNPGTTAGLKSFVDDLKAIWDWINKLLGPIDETGKKWAEWGANAGKAAADVVNAIATLPDEITKVAQKGWNALVNFDWAGAGRAIVAAITSGLSGLAGAIGRAAKGALKFLGGGVEAEGGGSLDARAMGGPVSRGLPYLVGERGPELFVPNADGSIKTAGATAGLLGGGGPSVDASALARTGEAARQVGADLHANIDALRKPIIDTTSLDEATAKATKLQTILASIGNSSINIGEGLSALGGGGGGGAGGGGGGGGGRRGFMTRGAGGGAVGGGSADEVMAKAGGDGFNTRGVRNMNPGNIGYGAWARAHGSTGAAGTDTGHGVAVFPSFAAGYAAMGSLALSKYAGGKKSIDALIAGRAGWTPGNHQAAANVARMMGISPGADARLSDPAMLSKFKAALSVQELGPAGAKYAKAHLAGARAMGGGVDLGSSYLVGERGPEIFTPGADGQISTNGVLQRLAAVGQTIGAGRLAPDVATVAKLRPQASVTHVRGDTHYHPTFNIHEAHDGGKVARQVEDQFWGLVRQAESEQRGALSD